MKILFILGDIWIKTEEENVPLRGNIILCPDNHSSVFYVDSVGVIWSMGSADYESLKKLYAEQEKVLVPAQHQEKVKLPPLNTTDAAHMVFNNCSQITIQK